MGMGRGVRGLADIALGGKRGGGCVSNGPTGQYSSTLCAA